MDPIALFRQIGWFALFSLAVDALPLIAAAVYVLRPTEGRLALMRPLSLAALFSAFAGTASGIVMILQGIAATPTMTPAGWSRVAGGASEALVAVVFGLTCLTAAWLLVAAGMWRGTREG